MSKRIIVTGGMGFIGYHLTKRLLEAGHRVTAIDNCTAGSMDQAMRDLAVEHGEKLWLWRRDFAQPILLLEPVDEIYHLAAAIGTKEILADPAYMLRTNIMLMVRALEAAQTTGAKLLYTSTAEVATGMGQQGEIREDSPIGWAYPTDPRWLYSFSKFVAEQLLRFSKLPHVIVRLANVYGPRMCHDYVVKAFIRRLQQGEPIFHVKSSSDTRAFCYVDDVVDGLIRAMETKEAEGETIMLAWSGATQIADLARTLVRIMGKETQLAFEPSVSAEERLYNTEKARKLLSWTPATSLGDGLARTVAYYTHENA